MVAVLARSLTPEPVTMGGMSAHRAHYTDLSPPSKQTTKSWKRGQGRDERRERYYKERKEKERKRGREKQRYFLLYSRPVSLFLGEKKTGVYIYQARSGWWPGLKIRVASEHITVNYTLYSRRPRNETKNTKPWLGYWQNNQGWVRTLLPETLISCSGPACWDTCCSTAQLHCCITR